jgi:hypothetical protein
MRSSGSILWAACVTCLIQMDPLRVCVFTPLGAAAEWTSADRLLKSHARRTAPFIWPQSNEKPFLLPQDPKPPVCLVNVLKTRAADELSNATCFFAGVCKLIGFLSQRKGFKNCGLMKSMGIIPEIKSTNGNCAAVLATYGCFFLQCTRYTVSQMNWCVFLWPRDNIFAASMFVRALL